MATSSAVAGDVLTPVALSATPLWRSALPRLVAGTSSLREVVVGDGEPLAAAIGTAEVLRYLPPGPTTGEQFVRFIKWVRRERRAGRYLCFAVVPRGRRTPVGLFQLWPIEPGFGTAEMGFALAPALWGTGTFIDAATAVVDFAFETLRVRRLEFRSATSNGRGTGALVKLGAVPEGTLRSCFPCTSGVLDHTMWSLLSHEWRAVRAHARPSK
jgi:RimJ/RimL family protein N-acetyltransferase